VVYWDPKTTRSKNRLKFLMSMVEPLNARRIISMACGGARGNLPAMLIGGKRLAFVHDRYVAGKITINELWGTIAQAFGYATTTAPFAAPIAGVWTKPSS